MIKKIKDLMSNKKAEEDKQDNGEAIQEEPKKKLSPAQKLQAEVEELEIQVAESKDKYLRLFAEFDNYKKRSIKEKLDNIRSAAQDTLSTLLPVLDDFDRAKKAAEDETSTEPFSEGVMMVYNKLYTTLAAKGLKKMETTGEVFDPEVHEAITKIPAPTEELKGKVVDTIESGFTLNDKIIRHAKVVIGE